MTDRAHTVWWEYQVRAEHEAEFLTHYAPGGTWSALFGRAAGYLGTELFADRDHPGRYATADRWTDAEALERFRSGFAAEYQTLDATCARLTDGERALDERPPGAWEPVRGSPGTRGDDPAR